MTKEEFIKGVDQAIYIAAIASIVTSASYLTYRLHKYFLDK